MKTDLRRAGVLNLEMEAATVFTISGLYGFRAGAVFAVVAHRLNVFLQNSSNAFANTS